MYAIRSYYGFNRGRRINVVNQRLGYLVRCGDPDALDSIVPMAFGNLALDLVLARITKMPVKLFYSRKDQFKLRGRFKAACVIDLTTGVRITSYNVCYTKLLRLPGIGIFPQYGGWNDAEEADLDYCFIVPVRL